MVETSVRIILSEDRNTDEIAENIGERVDTDEHVFFAPYPRDSRQVSAVFNVEEESKDLVREVLTDIVDLGKNEVLEVYEESEEPW